MIKRVIGALVTAVFFGVIVGGLVGVAVWSFDLAPPPSVEKQSLESYKPQKFDTIQEAVTYAAERLYACSQVYECAARIAKSPDGKFVVSRARSDRQGDHVRMPDGEPPTGWVIVADVHSHPCLPDSHEVHFFSPDDTAGNILIGEVGIMLDECTGEIHVFDPSTMKPGDTFIKEEGIYLTKGLIVGKIKVSGASVEPDTDM